MFASRNVRSRLAAFFSLLLFGVISTWPAPMRAQADDPAPQTISFGAIADRERLSGAFSLTATASSSLTVVFASSTTAVCTVSGSTVSLVAMGVCTIEASQAGDSLWLAATPVEQSFDVTEASQSITFGGLADRERLSGAFSLMASASSGLTVSFASTDAAVCTVSGSTVSLVAMGICELTASQGGDGLWFAADDVVQSFDVTEASQSITFGVLSDRGRLSGDFTLSATASSGLTVAFVSGDDAVCTVTGATVSLVAVGTCEITASQDGDADWFAATDVVRSFQVIGATQKITFGVIAPKFTTTKPFRISATSNSLLPVALSSTTTSVCSLASRVVTIVAVGTCTIMATQAGDEDWLAATPVTRSFSVTVPALTIANTSVVEGNGTIRNKATSVIALTGGMPDAICVWYSTFNGTATGVSKFTSFNGSQDYLAVAASPPVFKKIAAGSLSVTIVTTVNYDTVVEANETYSIVISKVTRAVSGVCTYSSASDSRLTVADGTGTVTITNDD